MSAKIYVMQFQKVFPTAYCKDLVTYFEHSTNTIHRDSTHKVGNFGDSRKTFTELLLPEPYNEDTKDTILDLYQYYRDTLQYDLCLPENVAIECGRMKRYNVGEGFGWHTDVGDKLSSSRMLVCMTYLNDDFVGGETEFRFPDGDIKVKPTTGTTVVFPATFTFPHRGHIIESGSKYIINQYLHYV